MSAKEKQEKLLERIASRRKAEQPETQADSAMPAPNRSIMPGRQASIGAAMSGKRSRITLLQHPPTRIRPWSGHNRNYELLNEIRCADLIEGFQRSGKQEFPAIVRRLNNDPDYDYEFICGARRHWTASHLGWDLLIECRELDDKEAFILQDIENRDREDISDYERALDYLKALPLYFNGEKKAMAKFLEIDRGLFSRLLYLSSLPELIIKAYKDIRDLKVHHGQKYKDMLLDANTKRRVLAAAKKLSETPVDGKTVLAVLTKAAKIPDTPIVEDSATVIGSITVKRIGKGGKVDLQIQLPEAATPTTEKNLQLDFKRVLKQLMVTEEETA